MLKKILIFSFFLSFIIGPSILPVATANISRGVKEPWLLYLQNGIDSVTRQPDAAAADRSNNDNADAIADNDIALEEREREQQGIVIDSVAEHPFYAFDILN